ncbi:MAG: divalent-cation tolerance protein CutA [bacterium]|nr:divalent-cation tolerance protein CutA [bacterium]
MEYIAVYTTLPDRDSARKLAKALVTERLTACANFFPVESIYRWEGKIEEEREYALILKTREELYPEVEKRIKELHPYKLPAIISYKIERGLGEYLTWIKEITSSHLS